VSIPFENNINIDSTRNKINALLLLDGFYVAGMQRHCLDLLAAFKRLNLNMTVITINGPGGKWADKFLELSERVILDLDFKLNWNYLQEITNNQEFAFVVSHLVNPSKWVIKHIPNSMKAYCHLHSEPSETEIISNPEFSEFLNRFEAVFFPSITTLDKYKSDYSSVIPQKIDRKFRVIPNPLPPRKILLKNTFQDNPILKIAVISRIDPDKISIPFLINTLMYLREFEQSFKVKIAGDGSLMTELRKEITNNQLSPFVEFEGVVEDIFDIYQWADVVFLPSKRESMPYVLLECISYQRPLVTTKVGILDAIQIKGPIYSVGLDNPRQAASCLIFAKTKRGERVIETDNVFIEFEDWIQVIKENYSI
jgi:glycosyltransferase involved in cell wall biosynthesis